MTDQRWTEILAAGSLIFNTQCYKHLKIHIYINVEVKHTIEAESNTAAAGKLLSMGTSIWKNSL